MYCSSVIDYVNIAGLSSARGRQTRVGWGNQAIFERNASISQKRYEIRTILLGLLLTNRKLHMRFRLASRPMTFDDRELL